MIAVPKAALKRVSQGGALTFSSRTGMSADREDTIRQLIVSRETIDRLDAFVDVLFRWSTVKNLISSRSWPNVWTRHILDSAAIVPYLPKGRQWADLGSGAGFPGIVVAIINGSGDQAAPYLIESDKRKAAFLAEAARVTDTQVNIQTARVEDVMPTLPRNVGAILSRATASMQTLLNWSQAHIDDGAIGLFLKGERAAEEIALLQHHQHYSFEFLTSRTSMSGVLIRVKRK